MKHEKSDWFKGFLFAEKQWQEGWKVCEVDYVEEWFSWTYQDTEAKQTVFGECEWLDGVRDFYKNQNMNTKRLCESL